ncbi:MAG: hypothetical protein QW176_05190 [Candidatus Bathyarchaeia archaeon]
MFGDENKAKLEPKMNSPAMMDVTGVLSLRNAKALRPTVVTVMPMYATIQGPTTSESLPVSGDRMTALLAERSG